MADALVNRKRGWVDRRNDASPRERFLARIAPHVTDDECWLWLGSITTKGYGRLTIHGREIAAHRLAYELFVGPIADGLTIDHVCHNVDPDCNFDNACRHRRCVNPAHLEAVPIRTNVLRGKAPTARRAAASTCDAGHPLNGENLYVRSDGHRACRECNRASQRRRQHSPKRLESNRRYRATVKAKERSASYRVEHADEQRAHSARYLASEKGKATRAAYRERNRERNREYQRAYYQRRKAEKAASATSEE